MTGCQQWPDGVTVGCDGAARWLPMTGDVTGIGPAESDRTGEVSQTEVVTVARATGL